MTVVRATQRQVELQREVDWRRCQVDEAFFLESFWKIRVPGKGLQPFVLRSAQVEVLRVWSDERYSIALKARQIGFSTLAAAHAAWLAAFHPDRYVVMLSRTERDAQKLLMKAKTGWKHLPEWLLARAPQLVDNNLAKMTWENGSAVESLPSASDPARGEAVDLVIVDEWAFLPNAEEAWASIEPVTDIGGRVIGISTANGSGNFFHGFYLDAKSGKSQFKSIFYPWHAVDSRDDAWYASKAASMLDWQLHQEYPSDDVECFIKSGNPVFDVDGLRAGLSPPVDRGFLIPRNDTGGSRNSDWLSAPEGPLRVWERPRVGVSYVIGADVAEGLEHGDFSSVHVIDTLSGLVAAKWHGRVAPDLLGAEVLWFLGWWYNAALIGPEVNNHGLTTCNALRDKSYPNIYYRVSYDERTLKQQRKIGWRTQSNTKPLMVDELAKALRDEITLRDAETLVELETFVRDGNGKMHGSPHDDQVISLGIANQMRKFSFTPQGTQGSAEYMTMGWLVAELDAEEAAAHVGVVGLQSRRNAAAYG